MGINIEKLKLEIKAEIREEIYRDIKNLRTEVDAIPSSHIKCIRCGKINHKPDMSNGIVFNEEFGSMHNDLYACKTCIPGSKHDRRKPNKVKYLEHDRRANK